MRHLLICLLLPALAACDASPSSPVPDAGPMPDAEPMCTSDTQCDDAVFCNGVERCTPSDARADMRGCLRAEAPACAAGFVCEEASASCAPDDCSAPDGDGDGHARVACGGDDCDDADADRFPGNPERCDGGHDEDCDDDTLGPDVDGDGVPSSACCNGASCGSDCDDASAEINPDAPESCNALDDDCDGASDEGVATTYYVDCDGDGYGAALEPTLACAPPSAAPAACGGRASAGWSENMGDCDDESVARSPAVIEICNGVDDDCDGALDGAGEDGDADGFAAPACGGDDCDDADASVHPGAAELCDDVDQDCDGRHEDEDGDGFAALEAMCTGGALPRTDCDDAHAIASPEQREEWCNGIDGNCSGDESDCDAIVDVFLGLDHACALFASGRAACWGAGDRGQLGDGMGVGSTVPVYVEGLSEGVALTGGAHHTCALLSDGRVACWGQETDGTFGGIGRQLRATVLEGLPPLSALSASSEAMCGIRSADRHVVCWGDPLFLGDRMTYTVSSATPIEIGGIDDAIDLALGRRHACVARASGVVTCWGNAISHQLGHGASTDPRFPVDALTIDDATAVFAAWGSDDSCARRASGDVYCWGANDRYELGLEAGASSRAPARSAFLDGGDPIIGGSYVCVIRSSGIVECRGSNGYGQQGNGSTAFEVTTPTRAMGIGAVSHVAAGGGTTCWLTLDEGLRCAGINAAGAAGDGGIGMRTIPTHVVAP